MIFSHIASALFGGGLGIVGHAASSFVHQAIANRTHANDLEIAEAKSRASVVGQSYEDDAAAGQLVPGEKADAKDSRWLIGAQVVKEVYPRVMAVTLFLALVVMLFADIPTDGPKVEIVHTLILAAGTALTWTFAAQWGTK